MKPPEASLFFSGLPPTRFPRHRPPRPPPSSAAAPPAAPALPPRASRAAPPPRARRPPRSTRRRDRERRAAGRRARQAARRARHLIPAADEPPLQFRLDAEQPRVVRRLRRVRRVEQPLRPRRRVGRGLARNLPREPHRLLQGRRRVVALGGGRRHRRPVVPDEACHEAQPARLVGGEDAPGQRELEGDISRHELRQRDRRAHVGDEAPLGLHDGEAGALRRDADVRPERDLESAAEAHAVDGRDDGTGRAARGSRRPARGWTLRRRVDRAAPSGCSLPGADSLST